MVLDIILIIAFLSATSIQLYFWIFHFSSVLGSTPAALPAAAYDILICAHNEAENLAAHLPLVARQDLAANKILVVDHGSTDHTIESLTRLRQKISNLKTLVIARQTPAKKEALMAGLEQVDSEALLLTDADCTPSTSHWAQLMVSTLGQHAACVGLAPLRGGRGFVARFAEHESMLAAFQYGAMAARGKAFMAVGRNLAYQTKIIRTGLRDATSGFLGGDDDLMINALRKKEALAYCGDPRAVTYSAPPETFPAFIRQKQRHVSTSRAYDLRTKSEIFLFASSHWFHYLFLLGMLIFGMAPLGLSIYLFRLVVIYLRYLRTGVPLHGKSLLPWLPLLDFLYSFYYPMLTFFLLTKPAPRW